jgi:hypothetical protein
VRDARFLRDGSKVPFNQTGHTLTFELPSKPLDPYNTVIVAEIKDEVPQIKPGMGYADPQDEIVLFARDARIRGEEARYDWDSRSVSGLIPSEFFSNELWWYHYPHDADTFNIRIEYACPDNEAGSPYYIRKTNRDNRSADQELTGIIEGTGNQFKIFEAGELFFSVGEYQIINLGLSDQKSAGLKIRKLILTRKN